jgi:hypothetical protein
MNDDVPGYPAGHRAAVIGHPVGHCCRRGTGHGWRRPDWAPAIDVDDLSCRLFAAAGGWADVADDAARAVRPLLVRESDLPPRSR